MELFYITPEKSEYPNGLYGSALEDRIFIHTLPSDGDKYIGCFEGYYLLSNKKIKGVIKKATKHGFIGRFDKYKDSLLEVVEGGDKLVFYEKYIYIYIYL